MGRYIALLRGINVGGKNSISMPLLKAAFEERGFTDVKTYINSGNVLFSSEICDEAGLKGICEGLITAGFNLEIPVAIISAQDLEAALGNAPRWWDADADSKHNAVFVLNPSTPKAIIEQVGAISEYERIGHFGQVIFWSAPSKTLTKTRWIKIVGTSAYQRVTIRNANTAKKLLELSK